jgi:hypothetical protein
MTILAMAGSFAPRFLFANTTRRGGSEFHSQNRGSLSALPGAEHAATRRSGTAVAELTLPCQLQETDMRLGARASDWHSGNPDVRPAAWIAAFVAAFIFAILVAALIGHAVNGNGSPFLS